MSDTALASRLDELTVLIVDDNAALRGALRVSLQAFGCGRVVEADTVDRALDTLAARPVDIIVTDWKMKPRDGLDFVRTLRRPGADGTALVPVIMLSAYSDEGRITAAYQAGVSAFLVKPFTAASLARVLKDTLDRETRAQTDTPIRTGAPSRYASAR